MTPQVTALVVGVALGVFVWVFGRLVGLDRERAYYATILLVVASYYALFAVMGGSVPALLMESVAVVVFWAVTVLGFKRNQWGIVAGLAGHGAFDCVHGLLVTNPGMPVWWPYFCGSIDVTMAAGLAWIVLKTDTKSPVT